MFPHGRQGPQPPTKATGSPEYAGRLDTGRVLHKCRHKGPLPVDALIRKFGDLALVEFALVGLKCTACGHIGASALMLRLCEPGCPRQR
jgi:hypothetical protein